jgi:hypothetical protein
MSHNFNEELGERKDLDRDIHGSAWMAVVSELLRGKKAVTELQR